MPVLLPTPDELARLPWHARQKAIKVIESYVRMYGAPTSTRRSRIPVENVEFGARVRDLARRLEAAS